MADHPDDFGSPPGLPRWVTVLAITGAVLIIAVIAVLLSVGDDHGPSRHAPGDEPAEVEDPVSHAPPDGGHG